MPDDSDSLSRQRDDLGRFVKAAGDAILATGPPDLTGLNLEPMQKWAGQPSNGGMGGSVNTTEDANYDPLKKPGSFDEVGSTGLAQYGGFVRDEFLQQLQGNRARTVFREMYDNDPIVGSVVFAIQMLVRKVEWRIEPPEAGSIEQIVAERFAEREQAVNERAQAQQQQLLAQQTALAGTSTSPTRAGPDGKPGVPAPPRGPTPGMAQGPLSQPPGLHQPLPHSPTSPTSPTSPGTNAPATGDGPGTNPSGGVAQGAALGLDGGLPGSGKPANDQTNVRKDFNADEARDEQGQWTTHPYVRGTVASGINKGMPRTGCAKCNQGATSKIHKRPFGKPVKKSLQQRARSFFKASSPMTGGIGFDDVDAQPVDPETGETMEFATGEGLSDATPMARHGEELAVLVETALHDMADSWADTLSQIMTMIVFGFSFHELVYKKRNGPNPDYPDQGSRFDDGKIGWAKIAGRAQETLHRWEFSDNGDVVGFWQLAPPKFQMRYIPMAKGLLFRTTAYKNNPEGRSILRSAYRPWFFKKRIEEYEAIGVERNLAGMPIAYVPYQWMTASATPEEKAALGEIKKLVRNLRTNEQMGVVFPNQFDPDSHEKLFELTLLTPEARSSGIDTDKIITRYEQRIAMNALADFILLGHDSVGARSLGETKVDLFTTALEAWMNAIADVFNTYAIPRLMQMNGEDPAMSPKMTFGKIGSIPLADIGAIITALVGGGATLFPDTQLEDWVRDKIGAPPKAASDDL